MALLRWEVRKKNKESFFNIDFDHQGEDEADWAYEMEPADEEVASRQLFTWKSFHFPNQASPQQVVEEVTSSEPREVNTGDYISLH